ncbi:MAG: hypothetical protein IJR89_07740 [Clostridia bacterium]|nr:hypothetical protein [Clostridia bacterium]
MDESRNETNTAKKRPGRKLSDYFDTAYLRGVILGVFSVLLVLGIAFYIVWHVTGGFESGIATQTALFASAEETIPASGFLFRDETALTSVYRGAADYRMGDGKRAAAGELLAVTYENTDSAGITARLKKMDAEIAVLENSSVGSNPSLSYTKALENTVSSALTRYYQQLAAGDPSRALALTDELLVSLNRKALIVDSRTDYAAEVEALTAERTRLAATLTGRSAEVRAPYPGIFYSDTDGYESVFTAAALEGLTPSRLDELAALPAEKDPAAVGKLASSRMWYLALTLDAAESDRFRIGEKRKITFTDCGDLSLEMKLENAVPEGDRLLLVYSSDEQKNGPETIRRHSVAVQVASYDGLRVPRSALRFVDGYTGVYARFGNTVLFRVADVIGTVDGYAYISAKTAPVTRLIDERGEPLDTLPPAEGESEGRVPENARIETVYGALQLYDEVIVSGTGLYDGLIFD